MELKDKKVLVVGLGKTGEALCRFLLRRGARVRVSERKTEEALGGRLALWRERGVELETGAHRLESFLGAELVVLSPGVPPLAEADAAASRGIPVISEIELAHAFLKGRIVGITGSNGKSTTTTLAHLILRDAGLRALAAGNIGHAAHLLRRREPRRRHIRHRSFRASSSSTPGISRPGSRHSSTSPRTTWIGTGPSRNISPRRSKLILSLGRADEAILNRDDPLVWALAGKTGAQV